MIVTKRCSYCGNKFDLPNTKKSTFMVHLVWYFECPCCHKSEMKFDKTKGQCADCTLPFSLIKHHGKGLCLRCHTKQLRYKRKLI